MCVPPGRFCGELEDWVHGLKLAEEARVQIITFPESSLTGYFLHRDDA